MIKISNFIILSLIIIVIFPSQISMHSTDLTKLTGYGLITFTFLSFIYLYISKKFILEIPNILLIILTGLISSSIVSYLMIGISKPIMVYGALISLFISVRILTNGIQNPDMMIVNIVLGTCLSGVLIIFLGFGEPLRWLSYSGFFLNPNSMGMFSAGLAHITIGVLYAYNKELTISKKFFFQLILFTSVILCLASTSRAGLFSIVLAILVIILLELSETFSFSKFVINIRKLKHILLFFTFLYIIYSVLQNYGLLEYIMVKFNRPEWQGGVSSGRFEGWLYTIDNWRWFGHVNFKEFAEIQDRVKFVGHSTWIMHLNNYGLLASFFFIGWILLMLYWAWQHSNTNKNSKSGIVLLTTLSGYIVNASFEEATSTPGLIISIIMFAVFFKRQNKKLTLIN